MTAKKTKTTKRSSTTSSFMGPVPILEEPAVREVIIEISRLVTMVVQQLHKEFNEQQTTPTVVASTNGSADKDPTKPERRKKEPTRVHAPPPTQIRPPSQPSAPDGPPELE